MPQILKARNPLVTLFHARWLTANKKASQMFDLQGLKIDSKHIFIE